MGDTELLAALEFPGVCRSPQPLLKPNVSLNVVVKDWKKYPSSLSPKPARLITFRLRLAVSAATLKVVSCPGKSLPTQPPNIAWAWCNDSVQTSWLFFSEKEEAVNLRCIRHVAPSVVTTFLPNRSTMLYIRVSFGKLSRLVVI